jgi:glucose/mannose transport system permease protein
LVLAPSLGLSLVFVYAFTLWTVLLSATPSRLIPRFDAWAGASQYVRLWSNFRWHVAVGNLAVFGGLFVAVTLALGLLLAILLDQRVRAEGAFRTIYLYPMAVSSIVTGAAWQWILNPTIGVEKLVRGWGWAGFRFGWLVDPRRAIYTVVIAASWQAAGFVMVLFLSGLRSIDPNLLRAAAIDGAGAWQLYRRVVLPALRPVFFSALVVLIQKAVVAYDLVVALTGGGPGFSTDLPATFMVATAFQRSDLGLGAAAATMMLAVETLVVVPYLILEMRRQDRA